MATANIEQTRSVTPVNGELAVGNGVNEVEKKLSTVDLQDIKFATTRTLRQLCGQPAKGRNNLVSNNGFKFAVLHSILSLNPDYKLIIHMFHGLELMTVDVVIE